MSILTEKYGLFKYDTATDGLQKFNINTALNNNWDKVETVMSANETAINTAGVYATAQGTNTITFSAMNSKPTVAVSFIVQFQDAITI